MGPWEIVALTGWAAFVVAAVLFVVTRRKVKAAEAHSLKVAHAARETIAEREGDLRRVKLRSEKGQRFIHQPVLIDLLGILDNFERAVRSVRGTSAERGIQSMRNQVLQLLEKYGAERVKTVGHTFDPKIHEAVSTEVGTGSGKRVIKEWAVGYHLHGRLLRAAKVVVAVPPDEHQALKTRAAPRDPRFHR